MDFQIFLQLPRQLLQLVEEEVVVDQLAPDPVAPRLLLVEEEVAEEPQQLLVVDRGPQVAQEKLLEDSVELVEEAV